MGAALVVAALTVGSAGNANADSSVRAKKTKVLGDIGKLPDALCPQNCSALAIVSGYQAEIDGIRNPYRIPFNGHVLRWKIKLGSVTKSQRNFFQKRFGKSPKAGISILKKVKVAGKTKYKLLKRGPVVGLNQYLGETASIKLEKRIAVKKGWYVALTVPTWAPALARVKTDAKPSKPDLTYSWRASREPDTCEQTPNMQNSEPQTKTKSKRSYGCKFSAEQLLYHVKVTNK